MGQPALDFSLLACPRECDLRATSLVGIGGSPHHETIGTRAFYIFKTPQR
jgi:hypothetical protein